MRDGLKKGDDAALEAFKKGGMEITEVTPAFRQQLMDATRPVVDRYAQNVDFGALCGPAGADQEHEIIAQSAGAEFPPSRLIRARGRHAAG